MKVLNCLHRSHFGGAHWRVVEVGEALRIHDIETVILFPSDEETDYENFLQARNFPYRRLRLPPLRSLHRISCALRFFFTLPRQCLEIRALLQNESFNLIYINGATNLAPLFAGLWAGVPVVWHFNDMLTPRLFVKLFRPLARRCRLAAASARVRDHYDLGDIPLIPPPLPRPMEQIPAPIRPAQGLVLGFVGNLTESKGVLDYVEVLGALRRQGLDVQGIVLGKTYPGHEGFMKKLHTRIKELELVPHLNLVGYQLNVPAWMRIFDALLLPSHSEAASLVLLQGLAAGIPIVSTDVGRARELAENTDIDMVAVGDIAAMTAAIWRALTMDETDRRSSVARNQAFMDHAFSIEAVMEKTVNLYQGN